MGDKQFAKEPLLFIEQPIIQKPAVLMQHDYYSPKQTEMDSNEENIRDHSEAKRSESYLGDQLDTKRSERFKDMTVLEKIEYLIHKPEHIPKVQCLINTDEKTYRGVVTQFKNDEVYFQDSRRRTVLNIPYEKIIDIKMIGF